MACNILTGISKSCDNNIGGVTKFYVSNYDNVTAYTLTAGLVTAITATDPFVEFVFNKNSSSYVEDAVISLESGSTHYATTTNLMIPRREVSKRNSLQLIAAGQADLFIILKDANGLYWVQGLVNGSNLTAQGEGSGAAKADGSKYSLAFLSEEAEQMPEIDPSILGAIGITI